MDEASMDKKLLLVLSIQGNHASIRGHITWINKDIVSWLADIRCLYSTWIITINFARMFNKIDNPWKFYRVCYITGCYITSLVSLQGVQHRCGLGRGCAAGAGAGPRLRPQVLRVRGPQVRSGDTLTSTLSTTDWFYSGTPCRGGIGHSGEAMEHDIQVMIVIISVIWQ